MEVERVGSQIGLKIQLEEELMGAVERIGQFGKPSRPRCGRRL